MGVSHHSVRSCIKRVTALERLRTTALEEGESWMRDLAPELPQPPQPIANETAFPGEPDRDQTRALPAAKPNDLGLEYLITDNGCPTEKSRHAL